MRTAIVIGAGGAGREIAAWHLAASGSGTQVIGFLDDDPSIQGQTRGDLRIIGTTEWLSHNAVDDVLIGVGTPEGRSSIATHLAALGITPSTVIHPTVTIGARVTISQGAVIAPAVILTVDVTIGRGTYLNFGAKIGHDTVVGDFAVVAPGASVAGNVTIGSRVDFGIGASAIQGVTIGDRCIVGGGACVVTDIPPGSVAVGIPAKPLTERPDGRRGHE